MEGRKLFKDRQILLFSRYPEPGKAKTRLIPELGEVRAAALQKQLTERIVGVARRFCRKTGAGFTLFGDGGSKEAFKQWLGGDIHVVTQASGNIGQRMGAALGIAFENGTRQAVLVGSDIPHIEERHLEEAFNALVIHDLVMGPSADGGYWLVGAKSLHDVFSGIDWGTDRVFEQTTRQANLMGLRMHCLEILSDIDTIDDVKRFLPEEAKLKPYISVIIPALNEEKNIAESIGCARNENAEVIVVDGGSRDRTWDTAKNSGAMVLKAQEGRGLQQNVGARSAKGEVLLFLHGDTRLPEAYARNVFMALMDPKTVLGAFRFKTDVNGSLMKFFEDVTNFRSKYLNLPYGDQGLFMRRQQFYHAGGFPEVAIAEDLLLVRRLSKKGRIRIASSEIVTSGRRWRQIGMFQTFAVNQIILFGCLLGVSPEKLAPLYRTGKNG